MSQPDSKLQPEKDWPHWKNVKLLLGLANDSHNHFMKRTLHVRILFQMPLFYANWEKCH